MRITVTALLGLASFLAQNAALAYVGPGAGISVLGALWGLLVGVVAALGIILFWPIRLMLRKRRARRLEEEAAAQGEAGAEQAETRAGDAGDSSRPA